MALSCKRLASCHTFESVGFWHTILRSSVQSDLCPLQLPRELHACGIQLLMCSFVQCTYRPLQLWSHNRISKADTSVYCGVPFAATSCAWHAQSEYITERLANGCWRSLASMHAVPRYGSSLTIVQRGEQQAVTRKPEPTILTTRLRHSNFIVWPWFRLLRSSLPVTGCHRTLQPLAGDAANHCDLQQALNRTTSETTTSQ